MSDIRRVMKLRRFADGRRWLWEHPPRDYAGYWFCMDCKTFFSVGPGDHECVPGIRPNGVIDIDEAKAMEGER